MTLPFDTGVDLDLLEARADACLAQMATGHNEWPGKPSRQRLELFLAANPVAVKALVALARKGAACQNDG